MVRFGQNRMEKKRGAFERYKKGIRTGGKDQRKSGIHRINGEGVEVRRNKFIRVGKGNAVN